MAVRRRRNRKDTKLDPATSRDAYRELILEEEADVTFGLYGSEPGATVQEELGQFETLHISGGTASMDMAQQVSDDYESNRYWFRTNWNGEQYGTLFSDFAGEY